MPSSSPAQRGGGPAARGNRQKNAGGGEASEDWSELDRCPRVTANTEKMNVTSAAMTAMHERIKKFAVKPVLSLNQRLPVCCQFANMQGPRYRDAFPSVFDEPSLRRFVPLGVW